MSSSPDPTPPFSPSPSPSSPAPTPTPTPTHAPIVIVGGGLAGVSLLSSLNKALSSPTSPTFSHSLPHLSSSSSSASRRARSRNPGGLRSPRSPTPLARAFARSLNAAAANLPRRRTSASTDPSSPPENATASNAHSNHDEPCPTASPNASPCPSSSKPATAATRKERAQSPSMATQKQQKQTQNQTEMAKVTPTVTLVDPKSYMEVQWATYRALFDSSVSDRIHLLYSDITSRHPPNFSQHLQANVLHIDLVSRLLYLSPSTTSPSSPAILHYDILVLAVGARTAQPILSATLPDAAARRAQLAAYGRRLTSARSVLVVGGGAVGSEIAGDVKHFASVRGNTDCEVTLVHKAHRLLPGYGAKAAALTREQLEKGGVIVKCGSLATRVGGRGDVSSEGTSGSGSSDDEEDEDEEYGDLFVPHINNGDGDDDDEEGRRRERGVCSVDGRYNNMRPLLPVGGGRDRRRTARRMARPRHVYRVVKAGDDPADDINAMPAERLTPDMVFMATGVTPTPPPSSSSSPSSTSSQQPRSIIPLSRDGWAHVDEFGRLLRQPSPSSARAVPISSFTAALTSGMTTPPPGVPTADPCVFAFGDCVFGSPKSGARVTANKAHVAHNVVVTLDALISTTNSSTFAGDDDKCAVDVDEVLDKSRLKKMVDPPVGAIVTTGRMSGVAVTQIVPGFNLTKTTAKVLPRIKNRTLFVGQARAGAGLRPTSS